MTERRIMSWFSIGLILVFLAIAFRTHWVITSLIRDQEVIKIQSVQAVRNMILFQIRKASPAGVERNLERDNALVDQLIASDAKQYAATLADATKRVTDLSGVDDRAWLLGADSYYYYGLVRQLAKNGVLGETASRGYFKNKYRQYPDFSLDVMTLHPYLGLGWLRLCRLFNPNGEERIILATYPLMLAAISVLLFLALCSAIGFSRLASIIAGITFITAPIFIHRSAFGWFDTDPYNLLFPLLGLLIFTLALKGTLNPLLAGILSGFTAAIYSYFWTGWMHLPGLLGLCAVFSLFLYGIRKDWVSFRKLLIYIFSLSVMSGMMSIILLSGSGLTDSVRVGVYAVKDFSQTSVTVWPSVFATIGETRSIGLWKLIHLASNRISVILLVLGCLYPVFRQKKRNVLKRDFWPLLMVFLLPLMYLALRTERFSLLCVLPFSILAGYGADLLSSFFIPEEKRKVVGGKKLIKQTIKILLFAFLAGGPLFMTYVAVSGNYGPILNSAWIRSLNHLKENSQPDSPVYSWWPPGYFIYSIADRKVVLDGGSQHLQGQIYWICRALMSESEDEFSGILRMLQSGGNKALLFLQEKGYGVEQAVSFIMDIVDLPRGSIVERLPFEWSGEEQQIFLEYVQSEKVATEDPYLLIYSEMIETNMLFSMIANWDFNKAAQMAEIIRQRNHENKQKTYEDLVSLFRTDILIPAESAMVSVSRCFFNSNLNRKSSRSGPYQLLTVESLLSTVSDTLVRKLDKYHIILSKLISKRSDYYHDLFSTARTIYKYTPAAKLMSQNGVIRKYANGVVLNQETMEVVIDDHEKGVHGVPMSVSALKDGKVVEIIQKNATLGASVLIADDVIKGPIAVIAERELLNSMLFKLFYFGDKSMEKTTEIAKNHDLRSGTIVTIYRVHR